MNHRVQVLNGNFDVLRQESVVDSVFRSIDAGETGWMCTVNSAVLMMMRASPELQAFVDGGKWVVADGQPIVWASRLFGRALPGRIAGIDLVDALCSRAQSEHRRVFLLGSTAGTMSLLLDRMSLRYPTLSVEGADGYFSAEDALGRALEVRQSGAALLFVGMGVPQQEFFIRDYWEQLGVSFAIGVGGSFDVLAGQRRRAPRWVQEAGFEWAYRLAQEPRRLACRYLLTGSKFMVLLLRGVSLPSYRSR